MGDRQELADLAAKLEQQSANMVIDDVALPGLSQQLRDVAAAAGLGSYIGTFAFAGQNSSGSYQVQFNVTSNNTGYSSTWPQWAFELAKDALLGGKQAWVLANGDPFGSNLVSVLILG